MRPAPLHVLFLCAAVDVPRAMIDYWLKDSTWFVSVTIEITDARGNLVRRFSSDDKPEPLNEKNFDVPMYWARPVQTLPATPGMHRFVWDLTYPAPEVLTRDFPMSALYHDTPLYPLGATVLPGRYTVTLTHVLSPAGPGQMESGAVIVSFSSQPLEVRMDPRVKTSPDDLRCQFELDRKIADALHRDYQAIQQVRSLRAQLKPLTEENNKNAPSGQNSANRGGSAPVASIPAEISQAAAALESKAAALEGTEGGWATSFLSTPQGRSLARLNAGFSAVLTALDSADAAPTTQQSEMFDELDKALAGQLAAWNQIKTKDVPDFNELLRKAGWPSLDPQKPSEEKAGQVTSRDRDVE